MFDEFPLILCVVLSWTRSDFVVIMASPSRVPGFLILCSRRCVLCAQ